MNSIVCSTFTQTYGNNIYACKCGCGLNNINLELLSRLDKVRTMVDAELIIAEACRCEEYNKRKLGVASSAHVKGLGVDIILDDNKDKIIDACKQYFDRVGIGSEHIHVDIDTAKPNAIWFIR